MAREVQVCLQCKGQQVENGICKKCGPTSCCSLDDFARRQDGTKEREFKERLKSEFPKMTATQINSRVPKTMKKIK